MAVIACLHHRDSRLRHPSAQLHCICALRDPSIHPRGHRNTTHVGCRPSSLDLRRCARESGTHLTRLSHLHETNLIATSGPSTSVAVPAASTRSRLRQLRINPLKISPYTSACRCIRCTRRTPFLHTQHHLSFAASPARDATHQTKLSTIFGSTSDRPSTHSRKLHHPRTLAPASVRLAAQALVERKDGPHDYIASPQISPSLASSIPIIHEGRWPLARSRLAQSRACRVSTPAWPLSAPRKR